MQANVGRETTNEVKLRRGLHAAGFRYRKEVRPIPDLRCKADVVFPRQRVCIFVDGCFWHGCPQHFRVPKANASWWSEKIQANVERDHRQTRALTERGWRVLRVWDHDLDDLDAVIQRIRSALTEVAKS